MADPLRFSTTPFLNTRQFYHGLATGAVESAVPVAVEYNHSPVKDQKLLCGDVDATTMSMGKYVTAKLVSHTDVVPTDPLAVAAGLTYREGNGLFAHAEGEVGQPADLAGARVGIHDTTLAMTYHRSLLDERFGVDPDSVEWVVDDHAALGERYERGDLDAVERINDWYWVLRDDPDHHLLYDMGQAWEALHGYYPLVHLVAVDGRMAAEDPDRVRAFLAALRASRAYREDNAAAILRSFVEEGVGEWTGDRSVEALRPVTEGVDCPLTLGEDVRRNVRDWSERAADDGVFASVPIPDERLFADEALVA